MLKVAAIDASTLILTSLSETAFGRPEKIANTPKSANRKQTMVTGHWDSKISKYVLLTLYGAI